MYALGKLEDILRNHREDWEQLKTFKQQCDVNLLRSRNMVDSSMENGLGGD